MSANRARVLLNISMRANADPIAIRKANDTFMLLNNTLSGNSQLVHLSEICSECSKLNPKLGAYIHNNCRNIIRDDIYYSSQQSSARQISGNVEPSDRNSIRILLYPGTREDIADLDLSKTTHNMIIQFHNDHAPYFVPTEPHGHFPSFYQNCASKENALLYIEALLVDACICHFLSITDIDHYLNSKQQISLEKVAFLREIYAQNKLGFLSPGAQNLVEYVAAKMNDTTPYVSFLSIFTIAPLDMASKYGLLLEDYCLLWSKFQEWYFSKHNRLFHIGHPVVDPLGSVFSGNKYQGQISASLLQRKIEKKQETHLRFVRNAPFGIEYRFAVVVLIHVPSDETTIKQVEALMGKNLYQSKCKIFYWEDLKRFDGLQSLIEIVPFMMC